jgi:hypothetical protein
VAKSASELLSELERQGLVPPQIVASLRKQVAQGPQGATAAAIADLLVQKGLLTPAQRASLLASPVHAADLFDEVEPLEPLEDLEPLDASSPLDPLTGPLAGPLTTADLLTASDPLAAAGRASVAVPTASAASPARPAASNPAAGPRRSLWPVLIGLLVVGLVGGGAAAAFLLLPRGDGAADFAAADADYQAQAWEAAIAKYSAALDTYPGAPLASLARVRRGLAQVHAAQSSGQDAAAVLAVAQEAVLPLADEPAVAEVRSELAPLLSGLAIELAASAANAGNPQALATARQALALASDGRLVPGDLRNWEELDAAERSLDLLEFEHERAGSRTAVIAAIEKAATSGDAQGMVVQVTALRSLAPEPDDESQLATAYQQLAAACQAKVAPWQDLPQPIADERPAQGQSVTLVVPQSAAGALNSAGSEGIEVVLAAGSAWGIDRSKGQILWRRSVGDGGGTAPLSAGGQVILVDRRHDEILGIAVASGQFRWRLPVVGGIGGQPQPLGDQLVVTTRGGGLLLVDRASGAVQKGATLPQEARTAALVEPTAAGLWQVADFGLVYRLSAGDLAATEVIPLGHVPASVTATPVWLAGQLVVAENTAAGQSILHALKISAEGKPTDEAARLDVAGDIVELTTHGETLHARLADGRVLAFTAAKGGALGLAPAGEANNAQPARQLSLVRIMGLTASAGGESLLVATDRGTRALPLAAFDGPAIQPFVPTAAASLPARANADSPDSLDPAILASLPIDEPIVAGPVVVGGFAYVGTPAGAIVRYPLPEPPPEMP